MRRKTYGLTKEKALRISRNTELCYKAQFPVKTAIYCIKDLIEYFNDRDNDYMMYNPEWSVGARILNGEVWYECYHRVSDTLKSDYDYSSRELREVLEYMNSCTGDIIYY